MNKLLQNKSQGGTLGADLELTLKQAGVQIDRAHFSEIAAFVKDKHVKDFKFRPHPNSLITFLVPEKLYGKPFFAFNESMVAYEDDAIVVADKPAGVSTQGTQRFGEDHLYGALISYYTDAQFSKLKYVGLHHRLDRDTSGLVLFTRKSSANKSIADQFKDQGIKKKYYAIAVGKKPAQTEWTCEAPIGRDFASQKIFRFKVTPKGDSAKTNFKWIREVAENRQLIECMPITGRTHQIRIHLKEGNLPILGDRTYGNERYSRMMLHAFELAFTHPLNGKHIVVQSKKELSLDT